MENKGSGQRSGRNRIYPFQITGTCRCPSFAGSSCRNLSRGTTTFAWGRGRGGGILREKRRREKGHSTNGKIEELARGRVGWETEESGERRKMETLDFSCSWRKREEVDGKALASDKTVLSLLCVSLPFFICLSLSFPLFRAPPPQLRLPIVCHLFFFFLSCTSLSPLLPRGVRAAHFCRAFKYCARKFDPLSKVQRRTDGREGRERQVDGVSKRV